MKTLACSCFFAVCYSAIALEPPAKPQIQDKRTWTMTNSFGVGYRNDRQRWRENSFHANLENFSTIQGNYQWEMAWERIILRFNADYGWMISGDLSFKGIGIPYRTTQQVFPSFSIGSGYTADIYPTIGARIRFWKYRNGSASFIPYLGYIYSHFNASPRKNQLQTPSGTTGFSSLSFTRAIQQDWFGPLVEGHILFSWLDQWKLDLFYRYTHLKFRETFSQMLSHFSVDGAGTVNTSSIRVSAKGDSFRTQLGGADFSYRSKHHWQFGAHFEGSATWCNTGDSIVRVNTDSFYPSTSQSNTATKENVSVHWTTYAGSLYAAYWF